ncbi:hypothetical protein WN55_10483 [Dufourea novaeangliae]|uniref:Uncharacterized protein n=1 Tax=Dufourea novaeangliae TaxID=178035 RepID=A0A154P418_DUFNO|nr:hypothetical protein WN55_10483 [Dufourea novaeangliae]
MVNSPATAATMASPSLEEEEEDERRWSSGDRRDHVTVEGYKRTVLDDTEGSGRRSSDDFVTDRDQPRDNDRLVYDRSGGSAAVTTVTVLNRDFAYSNQLVPDDPSAWESPDECAWECSWECPWIERKPYVRRSRKQSTPRKVIGNQEFEEEDMIFEQRYQEMFQEDLSRSAKKTIGLDELKMRYRRRLAGRKLLKCTLCPRESLARGRSYHTKASLVLHKFWRHGPRKTCLKSCVSRDRPLSLVSSITLRATVFTSPGYGYHR